MYTLIEIFDSKQYENIITPVSFQNISKLIYVGSAEVMTAEKVANIRRFFSMRKASFPIEFIYIERDNSGSIKDSLQSVIEKNRDCIFDVTGGEDVILVNVGIIAEKYSVPVMRTDARSGKNIFINGHTGSLSAKVPSFCIEDFICLQGGKVLNTLCANSFSPDDKRDILQMFKINSYNCEFYSMFCNFVAEFISYDNKGLVIPMENLKKKSESFAINFNQTLNIMVRNSLLYKAGNSSETLTYFIKSACVASCLKKAGNVLENYTALAALDLSQKLSDIKIGASIEWNSSNSFFETHNEIDVLAISDNKPVFISCKNGDVKKEALYELDAVSRALGGSYTKKVLVCTYISKNKSARDHLIKRARDMNIGIVFDTHKKDYKAFRDQLDKAIR